MIPLSGYTYVSPVGTPGHFGVVYHATNDLSGQDVAIKHIDDVMTPDTLVAWETEAKAMAACSHDNLVAILHAEVTPDGPALVMEYLPDGSVAGRFGGEAAPVGAVVDIAIDVCWGLHRLHMKGLTHRDIKPANLLVDGDRIKLGDFGLSGRAFDPADRIYVAHKPPEIELGDQWTEVADIYALSATAWRLLWGDKNNGRDSPDLRDLVAAGKWPNRDAWPIHVHKRLRTALRAGLEPRPEKRPPSVPEFRTRLERARPRVSWSWVQPNEWEGVEGTTRWHVRTCATRSGHVVETARDAGHGLRKVGAGCARGLSEADAEAICRAVFESLAATGVSKVT